MPAGNAGAIQNVWDAAGGSVGSESFVRGEDLIRDAGQTIQTYAVSNAKNVKWEREQNNKGGKENLERYSFCRDCNRESLSKGAKKFKYWHAAKRG